MSSHHIYNLCVNAKWVRELCDMVRNNNMTTT